MKKLLLFFLISLPVYLTASLYLLDKQYFLCPIEYARDIVIRCDNRGDGYFAANRKGNRAHNGIDLLADIGTPVLASRSGWVKVATQKNGMGNYIIIKHPDNISTLYGHLSEVFVSDFQFVRQGQVIGSVGKTGNANHLDVLAHLHFEVRKDNIPQDPMQYLR